MNVAALLHPEPAPPRLFAQPAPPSPLAAPTPLPVSKTITRPPLPRSPSPPSLGARVHLGTYLYPHLPFPYSHIPAPEERTVTLSVVVRRATAELALAPNARADPSLWGGAASQPARVYTDDSDVVQAAIHSGRLPANPPFVARCAVLELRLWPDTARYPGAVAVDGSLKSKSWNAPHDGAAFEVLRARWTSEVRGRSSFSAIRRGCWTVGASCTRGWHGRMIPALLPSLSGLSVIPHITAPEHVAPSNPCHFRRSELTRSNPC
ncbi:hypothetical protein EXIGLDRAFT_733315 [Exidia glandulosa HHB12029]|uniref:Uncharacterized protein n=1 Tax=Exidia glandulosa HHB12029 TaxID=1314781 RepID=A0A165KIQ8_EXIGL|nr:hypothetical protein EXIGLDRAFT_733315 [Exidia glandulosa HHB12029]